MKKLFVGAVAAVLMVGSIGPASSATLMESGTLFSTDDLTRIDDSGTVLEFLNLSRSDGQTISSAVAAHSSYGFAYANSAQVTALLSAFGSTWNGNTSSSIVDAGTNTAQEANIISHLGVTFGSSTLGYFGDTNTAFCFGINCGYGGWVGNWSNNPHSYGGVTMVRVSAVPLPAGLPLLLAGLGALGFMRKRRHI
ncbi:hypothetical protein DL239_02490 [Sedimentitalea sp. CY04]|uniref:VPLPA-CTERM sorting domain-containing protein n=1 Tax=Parasedimentitalea denitrificans TaxID=2211118 RepID=A0ABX0W527_9RHOB|nr:VPLPA-CTERM sorting domain-containing protein [Sedimentitalea sp. CY04]NIZ59840.1 hypothetical protein [Sedimentitalea sp. CY04]